MKPRWKRSRTLSKKLIGAARMQPKCWASVTRRCSTKSASLDLIQGAPRARIAKKKTREAEEELQARVPYLQILHRQAGIASGASTCNGMVVEGVEFSRITCNATPSGV